MKIDVIIRVIVDANTYEEASKYALEDIAESVEWINEKNASIYGRYTKEIIDIRTTEVPSDPNCCYCGDKADIHWDGFGGGQCSICGKYTF